MRFSRILVTAAVVHVVLIGASETARGDPEAPLADTPVVLTAPPAAPAASDDSSLKIEMFADARYVLSTRKNDAVDETGAAIPQPAHRAWERNNGFELAFLGLDATYDREKFAVTTSLRFGTAVAPFYANSTVVPDLDGVAAAFQAYGTWKASPQLTIDVGRFNTIYGTEVAESWKNTNYTRGALYYAFQPFWHTGARASYEVSPALKLTGMVVNGVNNSVDSGAEQPSVGAQATFTAGPASFAVGYLGSADPGNDMFDHFVDVIATLAIDRVTASINADLFANEDLGTTHLYYGVSGVLGCVVSETFRVGGRAEVLQADLEDSTVYTGTVTLDYRPLANSNLVLRLDNRAESSNQMLFIDRDAAPSRRFFQTVFGVVVTSQ